MSLSDRQKRRHEREIYPLYAEMPGWIRPALERARAEGGHRSIREWLQCHLESTLSTYRNGHD